MVAQATLSPGKAEREMIALLVRYGGKPRPLAREAIKTLGVNAPWDELVTYGNSGEPEAQAELGRW